MNLTVNDEKRIREIIRLSRNKVKLADNLYSKPGTFAYAYWLNSDIYFIGNRKIKAYKTLSGKSIKSQSMLIGETADKDNGKAYADLCSLLESFNA